MDSLSRYRDAIRQVLSRYADLANQETSDVDVRTYCAFDEQRDQYLVVRLGWVGQRRVKGVILHLRIEDGKVWLEENGTDREIASELAARGVPPTDIIIGFHHPSLREPPAFAVAGSVSATVREPCRPLAADTAVLAADQPERSGQGVHDGHGPRRPARAMPPRQQAVGRQRAADGHERPDLRCARRRCQH